MCIRDRGAIPHVVVDEVVYDDLAPFADADGNGQSLNRDGATSNANLAASWIANTPSPGTANNLATAPTVLSTVVNNGEAQRSTVSSLVVTFEGDVEIDAGAILVFQRSDASGSTGAAVGTSHTTALVGGNTVVTISFNGNFTRNSAGALVDGNYQLGIDGSRVRRAGTNITGQNYSYAVSYTHLRAHETLR